MFQMSLDLTAPEKNPVAAPQRHVSRYRLSLVREATTPYDQVPDPEPLNHCEALADFLWREIYHDAPQEMLAGLFLDARHRLIGYRVAHVGGLSRCPTEPRAILVPALLANAHGVVIAHNHPTGDPAPSTEDLDLTRRLAEAGKLLGLRLIDHIIIGDSSRWVSLKRRGGW